MRTNVGIKLLQESVVNAHCVKETRKAGEKGIGKIIGGIAEESIE